MAAGMVLVIVTRNIDLSIGSMLGFIGMVMGVTQAGSVPRLLGFEYPLTWILTLAVGLCSRCRSSAAFKAFWSLILAFRPSS